MYMGVLLFAHFTLFFFSHPNKTAYTYGHVRPYFPFRPNSCDYDHLRPLGKTRTKPLNNSEFNTNSEKEHHFVIVKTCINIKSYCLFRKTCRIMQMT